MLSNGTWAMRGPASGARHAAKAPTASHQQLRLYCIGRILE
jgi:hypothetical protein